MPYQLNKIIIYLLLGYVLLMLIFSYRNIKVFLDTKKSLVEYLMIFFFVFFLIFTFISVLFSVNFRQSLTQHLIYLVSFFVFIGAQAVFHSYKMQKKLSLTLILVTVLLSAISLYQTIINQYVNRWDEGVSFMWIYSGHNHLSALLIFTLPLSIYFLKIYWSKVTLRILFLLTVTILTFSLYFSFARASIAALFLSTIFLLLVFPIFSRRKVIIAAFITVLLTFFILIALGNWSKTIGIFKDNYALKTRLIYWQTVWRNSLEKPLAGTGLDTIRYIKPKSPKDKPIGTYYAHNFFLQILSDAGIFSFLSSLGLICMVLFLGYKKIKKETISERKLLFMALWIGIFASTLNSLVDFDWQLPTVFFFFWLFAGSLLSPKFDEIN